jgi:cobalt-zinc-cadmium efflux system protein
MTHRRVMMRLCLLCRLTGENPKWLWVDPACTLLFASSVIYSTKNLLSDTLKDLMEAAPRHLNVKELAKRLCAISGVRGVHDLHVWGIGTGKVLMTAHIDIEPSTDRDTLVAAADSAAMDMGITHSTVQLCT